ncbi:alpha/beta fold hydrolase [Ornithinibacillus sp. L9]|uniref:Alpha/beta fold hydrolase n=1 Tax=Ornithinibacillus caprae TaxID=2678566 RepID=A0A6N8FLU3_9BACI|nr:alpha/beta hydrolase [Ornithinibacillus caprae]MUK90610.1 alpha/beta fold hydrolase [Ornithinibacillus caprae]
MGNQTIYKNEEGKRIIKENYERYLDTFDFNVERIFVETSYGKTHVLVAGPDDGKPVFVFQGGNCINPMTLSWFLPLVEKYRIYAPDTIGHPGYSDENRISAEDHSFAHWIKELMDHFQIDQAAFIGPSYGAGITLRLATYMPEKIACSVLVAPAGMSLGSKREMIRKILIPLIFFHLTSSEKYIHKISNVMSDHSMKKMDQHVLRNIFKYLKLEQDMPKLTEMEELQNYNSPTLVISGQKDIFFPESRIKEVATDIIPNLTVFKSYNMGHFPSSEYVERINEDVMLFLEEHY